ncbi:MAG: hypothetical protein V3V99_06800 [candidate division Zixibacteria bacterium]
MKIDLKTGLLFAAITILLCSGFGMCASSIVGYFTFRIDRNRTILPVRIGASDTLDIILDSGMGFEGFYFFHKELKEQLNLNTLREVIVPGAGSGEGSKAWQADSATAFIGDMVFENQMLIISQSEYTQTFSSDGVTGWTLLGPYAVEINYDKMLITMHDPAKLTIDSSWTALDINLKKNIPFLDAAISIAGEDDIPITCYIDFAAGEALELLERPDMKFTLPESLTESYLGTGLSGDIYGRYGRIAKLKLASFEMTDVKTAFAKAEVRSKQEGADGIIGSDALRRFNVIFDYNNLKLYLKPNSNYDEPFE